MAKFLEGLSTVGSILGDESMNQLMGTECPRNLGFVHN